MPEASTKPQMICLGATIPPSFSCLLKDIKREKIEGVKWVDDENLFLGFQSFYKKRDVLDLRELLPDLKMNIYEKFFPIQAKASHIELYPNSLQPSSIKIKFDLVSSKNFTLNPREQQKKLSAIMKELLKTSSVAYQSYDCDLQITLAYVNAMKAQNDPKFSGLMDTLNLKGAITEAFYLDKLCMVEVIKEPKALKYDYYPVK